MDQYGPFRFLVWLKRKEPHFGERVLWPSGWLTQLDQHFTRERVACLHSEGHFVLLEERQQHPIIDSSSLLITEPSKGLGKGTEGLPMEEQIEAASLQLVKATQSVICVLQRFQ